MSFFALAGVMVPVLVRGMKPLGSTFWWSSEQGGFSSCSPRCAAVSLLSCCPEDREHPPGTELRRCCKRSRREPAPVLQHSPRLPEQAVGTGDISFEGSALMCTGSHRCEGVQLLASTAPSGGSVLCSALAWLCRG